LSGLLPAIVSAQQAVIPLQLSFSDPGARSMGFGGAFVALADDATAAFANPAGLTQLIRPEFSIEVRHWSHTTPYAEGGRVEGLPSGFGIDTTAGLRTATSKHDTTGLSFLSFAYPVGNWSFAIYRHQYADIEFSGATQGLFGGGTNCCQLRQWDSQWTSEIDILTYGLSTGYRIRLTGSWSVGGVYRQGMEVDIGNRVIAGEAVDFGVPPGEVISQVSRIGLEFPDIFGLGFAYRHPGGGLTVSFQWDRVLYSNIPDSLRLDDQTIDDADELHLGAEYVFLDSTPIIALRLGTWYEPDHQMRPTIDDPWLEAMTVEGDDEFHFAAGLGLAMERYQFDLAMDFSDRLDTVSLSAVFNF
jgi:hypothetical protein